MSQTRTPSASRTRSSPTDRGRARSLAKRRLSPRGLARGRARRTICAASAAAGLLALPAVATAQYSVFPVILEMAAGGTARSRALTIRNDGARSLDFRLYLMDFIQEADGSHEYLPHGRHPASCAGRLSVYPDALSVPAGGQGRVTVRLETGASEHTCWSIIFVEHATRSSAGLRVAQRIGVKTFGLAEGGVPEGELLASEVERSESGAQLVFDFANRGSRPLRPQGSVEFRSVPGGLIGRTPIEAFGVLPGGSRTLRVAVPDDLPPGRYVALSVLDFGGDYLAGAQAEFRVPEQ